MDITPFREVSSIWTAVKTLATQREDVSGKASSVAQETENVYASACDHACSVIYAGAQNRLFYADA